MVYLTRDAEGATYGYIVSYLTEGTIQPVMEGEGFRDHHQIFTYIEEMKKAISTKKYRVTIDKYTRSYMYEVWSGDTLLRDDSGWQSSEEVEDFLKIVLTAMNEGINMSLMDNLKPQKAKNKRAIRENEEANATEDADMLERMQKAAGVEENPNFKTKPVNPDSVTVSKTDLAAMISQGIQQGIVEAMKLIQSEKKD